MLDVVAKILEVEVSLMDMSLMVDPIPESPDARDVPAAADITVTGGRVTGTEVMVGTAVVVVVGTGRFRTVTATVTGLSESDMGAGGMTARVGRSVVTGGRLTFWLSVVGGA